MCCGEDLSLICSNPIRRFLPSSLSSMEKDWIAFALRYNFPERHNVVDQLNNCSITREETPYGLELIFNDLDDTCVFPNRIVMELGAMRESGMCVCAQLLSWKGRLDSFYIYTPDGSELCLDLSEFDDAWFSISDYLNEANKRIENLYAAGSRKGVQEEIRTERLFSVANDNRTKIRKEILPEIASGLEGCEFREYGSDPFSVSLRIDLGALSTHTFYGIVKISLLGEFYCIRAVNASNPRIDCMNYPSGGKLLELGDMLSDRGYRVLSQYYLDAEAQYQPPVYKGKRPATISDCLFSGIGIL